MFKVHSLPVAARTGDPAERRKTDARRRARRLFELPFAGIIQIRFKGYVSPARR